MSTDTARPARRKPGPKPKTSKALENRIKRGLPLDGKDSHKSTVTRIAGMLGNVSRWAGGETARAGAELALNKFAEIQEKQGITLAKDLAVAASPQVVRRLVDISQGGFKAGVRDQIAAGRLVLELAGALDRGADLGEDRPLSQESVGMLRQVIASGEERIRALEAAIAEREASIVSDVGQGESVAAQD